MKYYVTADPHGYYTILKQTLTESDFFTDSEPHKLIILGDLFDRGSEACELQEFVLDLMERDQIILIKGNHEDLFVELVTEDHGITYRHHVTNGTFDTAIRLTGYDKTMAGLRTSGKMPGGSTEWMRLNLAWRKRPSYADIGIRLMAMRGMRRKGQSLAPMPISHLITDRKSLLWMPVLHLVERSTSSYWRTDEQVLSFLYRLICKQSYNLPKNALTGFLFPAII